MVRIPPSLLINESSQQLPQKLLFTDSLCSRKGDHVPERYFEGYLF